MWQKFASVLTIAALLLLQPSSSLRAQHVHAHDVEVIHPPKVKPAKDENAPDLKRVAEIIVEKTNAFRKEEGRNKVEVNAKLARTTQYFSDYMASTDRYGHTADGNQPADRARKYGYDYCIVLENIAYQYSSRGFTTDKLAEGFFEGWKHSPGHRRNMLDADVIETGVAVARSEKTGYYYAVQMFGRPKSEAIEFQISNEADAAVKYNLDKRPFVLEPNYIRTHTICRPIQLTVHLPDDKSDSGRDKTVKVTNGDRFVITRSEREYQLKKE